MGTKIVALTGCFVWQLLAIHTANAQQMVFPGADWNTSSPEEVFVDPVKLTDAVAFLDTYGATPGAEELVVVRNGRLIWEGPHSQRAHHTHSVTKSFATTALGLLIDDGLVSLDTLMKDYVPAVGTLYPDVTLRHAATHTSGYVAAGESYPITSPIGPEDPFDPGAPLFPPGSQYAYHQAPLDLMMNVLTRAAGEPMQNLFQRRIGDTIGLDPQNWDWGHYTTADELIVNGGGGYEGTGIVVSAYDLARLGQLFLNHGNWYGQQLISTEWAAEATSVQVPASTPRHPQSPVAGPGIYGYGWWVWDGGTYVQAIGYENNNMTFMRDSNAVVARLGTSDQSMNWGTFWSMIGDAFNTEAVWDSQGDGSWEHIDPTTGKSRWLGPSGVEAVIYPDHHPGTVLITSDVVTASDDHLIGHLVIDGGRLVVSDSTLTVDETFELQSGSVSFDSARSHLVAGDSMSFEANTVVEIKLGTSPLQALLDTHYLKLDGAILNLTLEPDSASLIDQPLNLFDWSRKSGEFDDIVVPTGTWWDLGNLYTTGEVMLLSILAGDFNGDGAVDGRDYLAWQRGESPSPLSTEDLNAWRENYGVVDSLAGNIAIPEPASVFLLGFAGVAATVRRRRCSR